MIKKIMNWKRILVVVLTIILVSGFIPNDMSFVQASEGLNGSNRECSVENLHYRFEKYDGGSTSSSRYEKPLLLIFFDTVSEASKTTFLSLNQISEYKDLEVLAVVAEPCTYEDITKFISAYIPRGNGKKDIDFCYSEDGYKDEMISYLNATKISTNLNYSYPVMIYIDASNMIKYVSTGSSSANEAINNMNKYCKADLDIQAPALIKKAVNVVSGVHLYWDEVDGADHYKIYRYWDQASDWFPIGTSKTADYIDKDISLESGKTYIYKILVEEKISGNTYYLIGGKIELAIVTYVETPDLTLRVNRATGIGLGWNKIEGATGYAIYRRLYYSNDPWVRVATINDGNITTWDDTSVKANNGTVYRYTVRALAGEKRNILSGCRSIGRTMVRLTSRTLNSAAKTGTNSIKCTWGTTVQATGYEVRFMVGSTVYKTFTIGNYKTGVKTFTGLKAGQTYKIQVRSYRKVDGVGSFYSAWSTPKYVNL